jgi:SAM-dependent methyltransferase
MSVVRCARVGLQRRILGLANAMLKPLGVEVVPFVAAKPWDSHFQRWIAEAEATAKDPNEVGDLEWSNDPLKEALETHYLPYIRGESVVLELGPGTGRVTRHIIAHCREMILADYSAFVCRWLAEYLKGKGRFRIYQIDRPLLLMLGEGSVDVIIANGVFEHIDIDDLFCFLEEFRRVLKPGGVISFNFDNIMTQDGIMWFKKFRREPGTPCIFRFYHPDVLRMLAEEVGLRVLKLSTSTSRFAQIDLQRPPA